MVNIGYSLNNFFFSVNSLRWVHIESYHLPSGLSAETKCKRKCLRHAGRAPQSDPALQDRDRVPLQWQWNGLSADPLAGNA
ncbi:MAG: hypothetical protein NTX44_06560 [Ignavibacteriales bacterium]|nr:hypothetical protein [Ignavibacteriales bacterium]